MRRGTVRGNKSWRRTSDTFGSTHKARDEAERAVRGSEKLLAKGRATALVVTDAQRAYAASEQTLAELETAIAQDRVAVFLALGGGWGEDTASGASAVEIEKR